MIRTTASFPCDSVASLHYSSREGLIVNGQSTVGNAILKQGTKGRVSLGVSESSGDLLLADVGLDGVSILFWDANQVRTLRVIESETFAWQGVLLGGNLYALATTSGARVFETDSERQCGIVHCAEMVAMVGDRDLLILQELGQASVWKISGCQEEAPIRVGLVEFGKGETSKLCFSEGKLAILGYDGEITQRAPSGSRDLRGRAIGLRGSCMASKFLKSGFLRTIWSSGWLVDFDHDSHESLRVNLEVGRIFRAEFAEGGNSAAVWNGSSIELIGITG